MVNSYVSGFGRFARLACLALFLVSLSSSVWGQGFGTIVGTVTDQSGAVVAGALIELAIVPCGDDVEIPADIRLIFQIVGEERTSPAITRGELFPCALAGLAPLRCR